MKSSRTKNVQTKDCGKNGRHRSRARSDRFLIIAAVLVSVFVAGSIYVGPSLTTAGIGVAGVAQAAVTAQTTTNEVAYPETTFADGKAKFFDYKTPDGKKVRYFIIKSSDGVIRAAFDACDVCWESGKGYKQDGDFMVCQNCGRRFQSTKVNVVTGGCNPSALNRSFKDGKIIITAQALNEGKRLFK